MFFVPSPLTVVHTLLILLLLFFMEHWLQGAGGWVCGHPGRTKVVLDGFCHQQLIELIARSSLPQILSYL